MFWETFCNSEMVTKKSTSIRKANKRYSHTHSHPWQKLSSTCHPEMLQESKHNHLTRKGSFKARITFPTI